MSRQERELWSAGANRLMRCRHGAMLFNRNDLYIGRSLEAYGEFSELEVKLFEQALRPGMTVVEAGANIGAHTVVFGQRVGPQGRVFAFEPQRLVFQTLCANLAVNGLTNVVARQAGLGAIAGSMQVPVLPTDRTENFGGVSLSAIPTAARETVSDETVAATETVPIETIDGLSLDACHFLKVDVEGMEFDVLRGGEQLLRTKRPMLYVENDRADRSPPLIEFLLRLEYRLYWHLPALFHADNHTGLAENLFPGVVSVNMLGLPRELNVEMNGFGEVLSPESDWRVDGV